MEGLGQIKEHEKNARECEVNTSEREVKSRERKISIGKRTRDRNVKAILRCFKLCKIIPKPNYSEVC